MRGGHLAWNPDEMDLQTLGRRDRQPPRRDLLLGPESRGRDPARTSSLQRDGQARREPAGGATHHDPARLDGERERAPVGDDDKLAHRFAPSGKTATRTIFASCQEAGNDKPF